MPAPEGERSGDLGTRGIHPEAQGVEERRTKDTHVRDGAGNVRVTEWLTSVVTEDQDGSIQIKVNAPAP